MKIEQGLIRDCLQGDRKAQLRLYDQCYSYMMSICIRYCKDHHEAGSRLNLAFLKVLQHLGQFDNTGSFKSWVGKITLRSIIDEFRAQQRHYAQHVYYGDVSKDVPFAGEELNQVASEADIEYLMKVISHLPPMDKQVFNLFAIDGYSHKEIAVMLNISEGTSKWHVHEARKKLKAILIKETKTTSLK